MSEFVPSVLATGQVVSRVQHRGRYLPESMRHPGKMLPSIARAVIGAYTEPGGLVVDPMCGIGTTLVEAVHLGRDAVGMEYEADFANLSVRNLLHAAAQGASGKPRVVCGDARNIAAVCSDLHGKAALVLTSPPYGASTHGQVRSEIRDGDGGPVSKWDHRYSEDRSNLAYRQFPALIEGFGQILAGSSLLLRPGGVLAVTTRPFRVKGELVDLPGEVITAAERAGLVLQARLAALLCGIKDGQLVTRASFFQILETRRNRAAGRPVCASAHEDLLVFQRADSMRGGDDLTCGNEVGVDTRPGRTAATGRAEDRP
ncbi:TRM11 family SAM-dependent methyltransferase [Actinocorallia sp. A-T 12471]|uniref:TRM11 family SAM-dependent methyltransferase n=1 Tax=Actinocorallia sp. A-T 12471 TaxID=3089813 RepID=UPI0029CE9C74|nr:DNA methyltransferase [Actinocorallia sp. A-T 12471]MDX6738143.1 DNA methyltransferase [Actinocorallia sp. A-T 12471]